VLRNGLRFLFPSVVCHLKKTPLSINPLNNLNSKLLEVGGKSYLPVPDYSKKMKQIASLGMFSCLAYLKVNTLRLYSKT